MYVCVCHAVSDRRIREAVTAGDASFEALQDSLDVSTCCGCCEPSVREILSECLGKEPLRHAEVIEFRRHPRAA